MAVVTLLLLLSQLPELGFILTPLSFLAYAAAALALIALAILFAVKKYSRRAISLALAAIMPIALWWPIGWITDYAHLGLTVWFGTGVLGGPFNRSENGFATYDWSVGLAGGPNTILIRDESDQIAMRPNQLSHLSELKKEVLGECAGTSRHLLGHYYVCTF